MRVWFGLVLDKNPDLIKAVTVKIGAPPFLAMFQIMLQLLPGLPYPWLPDEPEAVPPGHPDLPPHHCQLWLDCSRPGLCLEGWSQYTQQIEAVSSQ